MIPLPPGPFCDMSTASRGALLPPIVDCGEAVIGARTNMPPAEEALSFRGAVCENCDPGGGPPPAETGIVEPLAGRCGAVWGAC